MPHRSPYTTHAGFTLIELMIVVAIIGILSSVAVSNYKNSIIRSKVAEGLAITSPIKIAAEEYYTVEGVLPNNNSDAGLPVQESFQSEYVEWARLKDVGGEIRVQVSYGSAEPELDGKRILLVAEPQANRMIKWKCKQAGSGFALPYEYMPPSCRHPNSY